ncbi:hypothetical protein [Calidithermus timidus]|jgi:hypothetical protein|uniref:hypothetical protein n=1 Tax=Calidithermus timidus TaxID=307124 RepID=UPI000381AED7|nr:hypothetical protein [Calidithermus timidus]
MKKALGLLLLALALGACAPQIEASKGEMVFEGVAASTDALVSRSDPSYRPDFTAPFASELAVFYSLRVVPPAGYGPFAVVQQPSNPKEVQVSYLARKVDAQGKVLGTIKMAWLIRERGQGLVSIFLNSRSDDPQVDVVALEAQALSYLTSRFRLLASGR